MSNKCVDCVRLTSANRTLKEAFWHQRATEHFLEEVTEEINQGLLTILTKIKNLESRIVYKNDITKDKEQKTDLEKEINTLQNIIIELQNNITKHHKKLNKAE